MEIILKYKGERVGTLGPADAYIQMGQMRNDYDGIGGRAEKLLFYMVKRMISLASLSPSYDQLAEMSEEVENMMGDFQTASENIGRMYMLVNLLDNKDFTAEVQ